MNKKVKSSLNFYHHIPLRSLNRDRAIATFIKRFFIIVLAVFFLTITIHSVAAQLTLYNVQPKVILISLDGATPRLVEQYLSKGILSPKQGLGLLKSHGITAQQNVTCMPSLTAACHIAIGTGSTTARNDINANTLQISR